jgi:hypothetical protein
MAKQTTRKWENVVDTTCEASGMPKKQVTDTAQAIFKAVQTELSTHQPKRDGDVLEVETPFGKVVSERVPEQVIVDASGNKFTRPPCCAVNMAIPTEYITAANLGLVDDAAIEKEGKAKEA